MLDLGFSLYMSSGIQKNKIIIERAAQAGMKRAFTSFQIPEETGLFNTADIKMLLLSCKEHNIKLFCDMSPYTLELLGLNAYEDLYELGVSSIRVDYGIDETTMKYLQGVFDELVFNASTLLSEIPLDSDLLQGNVVACHNYYPKQLTGISLDMMRSINKDLHAVGATTLSFVPGDGELRGPLYEGLPTVEAHRAKKEEIALNVLESYRHGLSDCVLIGDIDCTSASWNILQELSEGIVSVEACVKPEFTYLTQYLHHDRADGSEWVFRSVESRSREAKTMIPNGVLKAVGCVQEVEAGTILISNECYGRYAGEVEVTKQKVRIDERYLVVGYIAKKDIPKLQLMHNEFALKLVLQK